MCKYITHVLINTKEVNMDRELVLELLDSAIYMTSILQEEKAYLEFEEKELKEMYEDFLKNTHSNEKILQIVADRDSDLKLIMKKKEKLEKFIESLDFIERNLHIL